MKIGWIGTVLGLAAAFCLIFRSPVPTAAHETPTLAPRAFNDDFPPISVQTGRPWSQEIRAAAPESPADLAAFLGAWDGTRQVAGGSDMIVERFVVFSIDQISARVNHSWGSAPGLQPGSQYLTARVLPGALLTWGTDPRFTVAMRGDLASVEFVRESTRGTTGSVMTRCSLDAAEAQSTSSTPGAIIYYPSSAQAWDRIPNLVVSGRDDDPRISLVLDAIDFWNRLFEEIGSPFRLGQVTFSTEVISTEYLRQRSLAIVDGRPVPPYPEVVLQMPGDLIVALSDGNFVSFGGAPRPDGPVLVGISSHEVPPRNLPNVKRNVIAHELGHAIGLGHNNDETKLMCGRPAPCRPDAFRSDEERYFPITDEEKARLLRLYPPTWQPSR